MMLSRWIGGLVIGVVSVLQIVWAQSVSFETERTVTVDGASIRFFMGQQGNDLYLDVVNTSGRTLACEITVDWTIYNGLSCTRILPRTSSTMRINVQFGERQFTLTYDPNYTPAIDRFTHLAIWWQINNNHNNNNNNSSSNDYSAVQLSASRTTLTRNQYADLALTILGTNGQRDTSFRGQVEFFVTKRSHDGRYYTANTYDYVLSPDRYRFSSTDAGSRNFTNLIRFSTAGDYRVRVVNLSNNRQSEVSFRVDGQNNNNSQNNLSLTSTTSSPSINTFVPITITARDNTNRQINNYNQPLRFEVWRRSSSHQSRQNITTSQLDNSAYRISYNTYTFPWSNNWSVTLLNFIRFYNAGYEYRLRVIEQNNSNVLGEMVFNVRSDNTSITPTNTLYRFVGEMIQNPLVNQRSDVRIIVRDRNNSTVTNANQRINFALERTLSPSSSRWTSASSSICRLWRSTYTFGFQDYGQVTLRDMVRCTRPGFYRLVITNDSDERFLWYVYFTIIDERRLASSIAWFTTAQRDEIRNEYRDLMNQINRYEANNTHLAYNGNRNRLRSSYYTKLHATVHNRTGRWTGYQRYRDARSDFEYEVARVRR